MEKDRVDAVVVGAGASGGIVAKELAEAGWRVVLLERGPWLESFGHLETRDAWVTGIDRVPFGPEPSDVRTVRASDRETARTVEPRSALHATLPSVVGGGSVYYGGFAWRFKPETFRLRSLAGPVPGANHAAWQIGNVIGGDIYLVRTELPDAAYPGLGTRFVKV